MKKYKFLFLSTLLLISACGSSASSFSSSNGNESNFETSSKEVSSESTFSSNNSEISSKTPIFSSSLNSSSEIKYVEWPIAAVQNLCLGLSEKMTEVIPSYDYATAIEIDTGNMEDDLYFGIYCHVTSGFESENIYIKKLKENNWKVSDDKIENFYEAYSPKEHIWLNFAYDKAYEDLEIYVSEAPITSWPEALVAENLELLVPGTKTVIPEFKAELYVVNFYEMYGTIAINGYGVDSNIKESYKETITKLGWTVENGETSDDYNGISPAKDVQINFYYDETRDEFNIDVQKKLPETSLWPKEDIANLISTLGLTGEVMEYKGQYSKVKIDKNYYPPAVIVYVEEGTQRTSAAAYNQMLLDNGYVLAGTMYGEEIYNYPGTTLAYHATYLTGACFTIEIFNLNVIKK